MKNLLFNLSRYQTDSSKPQLLRIILTEKETRFDFGYQTHPIYVKGGWVTIHPKTLIRIKGTNQELYLTRAENIPVRPQKHHFESRLDRLYFSLYFPSLPEQTLTFDLIEADPGNPDDFNYYNIRLRSIDAISIMDRI